MSAFDKRCLQWLDNSTCSEKSKLTMLNRVNLGISGYRTIPLNSGTSSSALPSLNVDYGVQDHIAKAVRKLESGEECPKGSLFGNSIKLTSSSTGNTTARSTASRPGTARRPGATPRGGTSSRRPGTAASRSGTVQSQRSDADSPPTPSNAGQGQVAFGGFTFGTDGAFGEESNRNNAENNAGDDDDVMDDVEDRKRRRMTLNKRASRNAVSAEVYRPEDEVEEMETTPKPADISRRVLKVLEKHHLFSHLDDKDLQHVVGVMSLSSVKKGEMLLTQGKESDTFHIVVTGSCLVKTKQNRKVNLGGTINEVGLMYDNKSEDTVEAAMAMTQVCSLSRKSYQVICAQASRAKRARYEGFLGQLKFLSGLEPFERLQLADSLKSAAYESGDYLIRYGEPGEWFSIILDGTVDVIGRDDKGDKVHVCTFKEGDCIGELEFLFKHDTVADVVATSAVKTAKMTTYHFEKVIGSAKDVLERKASDDEVYGYYRQQKEQMDAKKAAKQQQQ